MSTGFTRALGRIGHALPINKFTKCLDASLSFASGSGGIGYLSVGLLTGVGVISSYVIEWHLGSSTGAIVLLSGYAPEEMNAFPP